MNLAVYHSPGSCSRVTLIALEEIGIPFQENALALMHGDQRAPAYLALNPKGKVPVLVSDGQVITETPAILMFLARSFPAAGLFPAGPGPAHDLHCLSDLIWCAGVLHPAVHRMFRPGVYAPQAADEVKSTAAAQLRHEADQLALRLATRPWWYGDQWSIMDSFLGWVFSRALDVGLDLSAVPAIAAHAARLQARPASQRALEREREAVKRHSITLPPGMEL